MATITITDEKILEKYSSYELKLKFIDFLKGEIKNENIDFFSISIDDLDKNIKKSYDASFYEEFIEY